MSDETPRPYGDKHYWPTEALKREARSLQATMADLTDGSDEDREWAEANARRYKTVQADAQAALDAARVELREAQDKVREAEAFHASCRVNVAQCERVLDEARKDANVAQRKAEAAVSSNGSRKRELEGRYKGLMQEIEARGQIHG